MSLPDAIMLFPEGRLPPNLAAEGFPHSLALLPAGITLEEVGTASARTCAMFLIDDGCSHITLNDPSFNIYLAEKQPIFLHAQRRKDLKPFMRRGEAFRSRGYTLEVLP